MSEFDETIHSGEDVTGRRCQWLAFVCPRLSLGSAEVRENQATRVFEFFGPFTASAPRLCGGSRPPKGSSCKSHSARQQQQIPSPHSSGALLARRGCASGEARGEAEGLGLLRRRAARAWRRHQGEATHSGESARGLHRVVGHVVVRRALLLLLLLLLKLLLFVQRLHSRRHVAHHLHPRVSQKQHPPLGTREAAGRTACARKAGERRAGGLTWMRKGMQNSRTL